MFFGFCGYAKVSEVSHFSDIIVFTLPSLHLWRLFPEEEL